MKTMTKRFAHVMVAFVSSICLTQQDSQAKGQSTKTGTPGNVSEAGENIFSPTRSETSDAAPANGYGNRLPRYRTDLKPTEKIRLFVQAGTPDLEQLKLIGSLKGKQRDEVVKAFEKGRLELAAINQEFSGLQKKMSGILVEKMLSKEEPQMDMMTKPEDFELLVKARNTLQKLRSKRLAIWEEIQAKLSSSQLDELDKLKSGELPADSFEPK